MKLMEENLKSPNVYKYPNIVFEYLEAKRLTLKELNLLKHFVATTMKSSRLNAGTKNVLKRIKMKVQEELEGSEEVKVEESKGGENQNEGEGNDEESKEEQVKEESEDVVDVEFGDELEELDALCEESLERYDLFLDMTKDIKVSELKKPSPPKEQGKRPRFTDIYMINNDEEEDDQFSNADYALADNEDLYFEVYSEYVRQSINPIKAQMSASKRAKTTGRKRNRRQAQTALNPIVEEESSEGSSTKKSPINYQASISKRVRATKKKVSPGFDKYVVKDSQNKNISKMRQDMMMLSQYIHSQDKSSSKVPPKIEVSQKYDFIGRS